MGGIEADELRRLVAGGQAEVGEIRLVVRDQGLRLMGSAEASTPAPPEPEAFRSFLRYDQRGRYRPLTGAIGLRQDWFLDCASIDDAVERIEIVYPLALRHRAEQREGRLRVVDAEAVLGRQTSRYADAGSLQGASLDRAVDALCELCVRRPCWAGWEGEGIPCPEPCSVFVALAQGIAEWGAADPSVPVDRDAGFADFDHPGNEVRCRFLSSRSK